VGVSADAMSSLSRVEAEHQIVDLLKKRYDEKEQMLGTELLRETERMLMLNVIDSQWKDHLLSMDHLKEGIGLRSYGQKDPLIEYKKESFIIFEAMMDRIEDETIRYLFFMQRVEQAPEPGLPEEWADGEAPEMIEDGEQAQAIADREAREAREAEEAARTAQASVIDFTKNIHRKKDRELADLQLMTADSPSKPNQPVIAKKTQGRNDLCSCGSGKKYKKCHGA